MYITLKFNILVIFTKYSRIQNWSPFVSTWSRCCDIGNQRLVITPLVSPMPPPRPGSQPAITLGESLFFSMASSSTRVVVAAALKLNLLRKCSTKAKHAPQMQDIFLASDWSTMCKTNGNPWQEIYFCLRRFRSCKFICCSLKYVDYQSLITIISTSRPCRDKWRSVLDSTIFFLSRNVHINTI